MENTTVIYIVMTGYFALYLGIKYNLKNEFSKLIAILAVPSCFVGQIFLIINTLSDFDLHDNGLKVLVLFFSGVVSAIIFIAALLGFNVYNNYRNPNNKN